MLMFSTQLSIGENDEDAIETWTILSKTKTNGWCDNSRWATIAWSASGKKTFDYFTHPTLLFSAFCFSMSKQPVYLSSRMFSKLPSCVNGWESLYPFSVNAYESEYSKIDESGNILEFGKMSSSVNLV